MGWAVVCMWAGDEASPRAFVEFGEHPIGQSLEGPADAVLTGKRQCQHGGKQGAENQRGGHGEGISMGWKRREAAGTGEGRPVAGAQPPDGDFCAQGICRVFAGNLESYGLITIAAGLRDWCARTGNVSPHTLLTRASLDRSHVIRMLLSTCLHGFLPRQGRR